MKKSLVLDFIIETILLFLGLWVNSAIIYLLFLVCVIPRFLKYRFNSKTMWEIAIYSIILPDNYSTIFLLTLAALLSLKNRQKDKRLKSGKIMIAYSGLFVLIIFSTIVHSVPLENIVFSIIYLSSAIFALMMISRGALSRSLNNCEEALGRTIRIEVIATIINFVMLLIGRKTGDDWSTGTFGNGQQAQVFMLFVIYSLVMLAYYIDTRRTKRKYLMWAIICFIIMLSTRCWAQLGVTVVFLLIGYVTTVDKRTAKRILIAFFATILIVIVAGKPILHSSIGQQVMRIVYDKNYRLYRAGKVEAYRNTFIEIPKQDVVFLLIGNGMGWYASRAALTCSGAYIPGYSKIFSEHMSEYTEKYIYPGLLRAFSDGSSDYGSIIARPYSTIIAIMGETGYLGILIFLYLFLKIAKRYGKSARLLLMIWLASCFMENYLEYAKIITVSLVCLYLVNAIERKDILAKILRCNNPVKSTPMG